MVRAAALASGLAPFASLVWRGLAGGPDGLGANPVETITHETGTWALRLLLATLAVTPLRRHFGWSWLAPERRTLGLLAFAYACLHFATWLVLDLELDIAALASDVVERPFVTAGFTSLVLMLPLAVTSTRGWMKRLGRHWQRLHRLAYPSRRSRLPPLPVARQGRPPRARPLHRHPHDPPRQPPTGPALSRGRD